MKILIVAINDNEDLEFEIPDIKAEKLIKDGILVDEISHLELSNKVWPVEHIVMLLEALRGVEE